MTYIEEWDDFKLRFETASVADRVAMKTEFEQLRQKNPVAKKEYEQTIAAYGPRSGIRPPTSWDQGSVHGMSSVFGSSGALPTDSE